MSGVSILIIFEFYLPMRAITKGFVLRAAATAQGKMSFCGPFRACGIAKFRSAGHHIGAVWCDEDGWLAVPLAVFDISDRVTQGS